MCGNYSDISILEENKVIPGLEAYLKDFACGGSFPYVAKELGIFAICKIQFEITVG